MPEKLVETPVPDSPVPRVLYVDDSWYMHSVVKDSLESVGCQVLGAHDGLEGVAVFRQERPDLVLMDIVLPGLDGFAAMSEIREVDPDAQIIVVSGLADEAAKLRAITSGALDFIVKPLSIQRLIDAVLAVV